MCYIPYRTQTTHFPNPAFKLPYPPPYFGYPDWESVTLCKYQYYPTLDTSSSHLSPLTLEVVGVPQMTLQQYLSIFPCLPLPSGNLKTPFPSIPWCYLPISSSVFLSFLLLSLSLAELSSPCQRILRCGHTIWVSLSLPCIPIAFWILLRTSSFINPYLSTVIPYPSTYPTLPTLRKIPLLHWVSTPPTHSTTPQPTYLYPPHTTFYYIPQPAFRYLY